MFFVLSLFEVITHAGLPVFITSIFLNMVVSETMCSLEVKEKFDTFVDLDGAKVFIRPLTSHITMMIAFPLLWLATGACLACSWYYPFLQLTATFMKPRSYSLLHVV
jgi:hypothetical protein